MMTGQENDFSVCTTWRMVGPDHYLIEVFRARLQYPDLRRQVASLAERHGAESILIEKRRARDGAASALIRKLQGRGNFQVE
jgi:phage terminase large subunit-like protein